MKSAIVLFVFFLICSLSSNGQQKRLDSLLRVKEKYVKEDSAQILLLTELYREYRKLKMVKERNHAAEEAISLGEKIKVLTPLPFLYNNMALYYEGISDFEKSIADYTRAIEIAEQFRDKEKAAGYYLNFGTVYHLLSDYPHSLALYQKAANYFIELGKPDDLSNCYVNMGIIYSEFSQQSGKALEYFNKALQLFQNTNEGKGDPRGIAETYLSIGNAYVSASDSVTRNLHIQSTEKYAIAREYYRKAFAIANEIKDDGLKAEVDDNIGALEEKLLNYPAALSKYQNALALYTARGLKKYISQNMLNIGRIYRAMKDFPAGTRYLHSALADARQMKVPDMQSDAYLNLSGIYESQHNFDSAYIYYKQYTVMRDSIFNNEKQKDITRRQIQYEFGLKEREYKIGQELADIRIKEQQNFALQQQQELELRNRQLELTNREKEIQKLSYLKAQAHLQAEQKVKILEANIKDQKIYEQQAQISFDRKRTIFLAVILVILSGAAFFVYASKRKTAKLNKIVSAQKEQLEEMGSVKDKIFSIVSHDMRAPVNNLVAFSSLLEDGNIEQERLALYVEQIRGTLDHTSTLMENLLNWAASQMQGFTPVIETVDISAVVASVLKGTGQTLLKKKIILHNRMQEQTFVSGDRNMIELIIRNLVSNAIKFSAHGGTLELYATSESNGVTVSVKDNGVGMAENKVQKINGSSTHTLDSTYGTDREKGTGLGLMLCKHFAGIMGGNISVNSRPGKGSLFNISLPSAA